MTIPIIMVTRPIGTPDKIIAAGFENPPDLAQMDIDIFGMQVLDHGRADRPIKHAIGKRAIAQRTFA